MIDTVKQFIKHNDTPKSRAIKNVYDSLYNLDDSSAKDYVGWAVDRIDQIFASNSVYRMLAEINQNEILNEKYYEIFNNSKKKNCYYRRFSRRRFI